MIEDDPRIVEISADLDPDEYAALLGSSHVCLAPARWEGLGVHLYEALALGMPTISNDIPEHVLLVVEDFDTLTHVLTFQQAYDPEEILNAYWDGSINMTMPDEGFEATGSITPTAPPPTPTSSTEAVKGSSDTELPSQGNSTSSNPALVVSHPADDTSMMILNMSDKPSLEEQADIEENEGEGERKLTAPLLH